MRYNETDLYRPDMRQIFAVLLGFVLVCLHLPSPLIVEHTCSFVASLPIDHCKSVLFWCHDSCVIWQTIILEGLTSNARLLGDIHDLHDTHTSYMNAYTYTYTYIYIYIYVILYINCDSFLIRSASKNGID